MFAAVEIIAWQLSEGVKMINSEKLRQKIGWITSELKCLNEKKKKHTISNRCATMRESMDGKWNTHYVYIEYILRNCGVFDFDVVHVIFLLTSFWSDTAHILGYIFIIQVPKLL